MQETFAASGFRHNYFFLCGRLFLSTYERQWLLMIASVEGLLTVGRRKLRQWTAEPGIRTAAVGAACALGGFFMSAASLANAAMPIAMGMICAVTGWRALVMALGSALGYWVFWGRAGVQGAAWAALGCLTALFMGKRRLTEEAPLLIPALTGFLVSASGLAFQVIWLDDTSVPVYLLRVAAGAASALLFGEAARRREPLADWIAQAVGVLALAQVAPFPWLSLGYIAGGALAAGGAFPAAALAGLALDLARVTPAPMTAVLTLSYLTRFISAERKWIRYAAPGVMYLLVMGLCGVADAAPIPGLVLGGALAVLLPPQPELAHRRGETGMAQVRLEVMAGVLGQTQQLLLEAPETPIDEDALLMRTRERACGGCPNRKTCRDTVDLRRELLHRPLTDSACLGFPCRKPGRMLLELRRCQEQLRSIRADRDRQREYRAAVVQQYQFLADYLRQLSDELPRRGKRIRQYFTAEVAVCSAGRESANGDRVSWFAGPGGQYFVTLCDGMGTGLGAAQEGQTAASLLRQMLSAGFPPEHALGSLNSLLALRGRAGAVTVDLARIDLATGKADIYKWGAAPSYVLRWTGAEKIGTAGPPPGISVTDARETVDRLSLRRGESLIMFSDGVDACAALRQNDISPEVPPGELAAMLLEKASGEREDDATAVVIRLVPSSLST